MTVIADSTLSDLRRLIRLDLRQAEETPEGQVRYLVDLYYQIQGDRIRAAHQVRTAEEEEPTTLLDRVFEVQRALEDEIKHALEGYALAQEEGQWALSILGVGPVITAGLLANLTPMPPTPSAWWRFAGLDPTVTWDKGEKRPWNAKLKTLCWKCGESFVKVTGSPNLDKDIGLYARMYQQRKLQEVERNEKLLFKDQAEKSLASKRWREGTDAKAWYEKGMLPPARIHLRAERYAVKMFMSHLWAVTYEVRNGMTAPRAWVLEHGGHVDAVSIPNWPMA